jgi:hypothetical protein
MSVIIRHAGMIWGESKRMESHSCLKWSNGILLGPVNSNKTGTITVGKHAQTCLKPRCSKPREEIARLKELRRVSRSGKFSQSLFSTKMSKKSRFSSKDFNFRNPNTIYLIVRTALHLTTAKVWKVSCLFW